MKKHSRKKRADTGKFEGSGVCVFLLLFKA